MCALGMGGGAWFIVSSEELLWDTVSAQNFNFFYRVLEAKVQLIVTNTFIEVQRRKSKTFLPWYSEFIVF